MSASTKTKFVASFICCIALSTPFLIANWQDIKLKASRISSFFTLTNNPLLPSLDKDLQALNNQFRVSPKHILSGGPPKDGIPAIDNPQFIPIQDSVFAESELIVGVVHNNIAKAYPYGILNWHEIVNDTIGGVPIAVTLCPLCDTNPVFIRKVDNQVTTFGVSGKLFQSCLVMYDRASDNLWSQVWGIGIAGTKTNQALKQIPAIKTTIKEWKAKHPDSLILSIDTGYRRDYYHYPYGSYYTEDYLVFPARNQEDLSIPPKSIISYIYAHSPTETPIDFFSGEAIQFNHEEMKHKKSKTVLFKNQTITVTWDEQLKTVRFFNEKQEEIPSSTAFAFVFPAYFNK